MQSSNNKIDAALLGKIVFARFLELPLGAFDRLVAQVESSSGFSALAPWVTAIRVKPRVERGTIGNPASPVLGEVCEEANGRLLFLYQRESCVREYIFDKAGLQRLKSSPEFPKELATTLRRLRLINSRNRLTHALVEAVLACQAEYLRSGQALSSLPLTQAQMSARLKSEPGLSVLADTSRISRLVRGLSITLPNRKTIPMAELFPRPRKIHCHFVDYVIKKEKAWIAEGILRKPLTDQAVAEILDREDSIRLSRRTVANIRHDLAIPDCRSRSHRMNYLAATEGFSALMPLTPQALRSVVPAHPGVYEIRAVLRSPPPRGRVCGAGFAALFCSRQNGRFRPRWGKGKPVGERRAAGAAPRGVHRFGGGFA